MSRAQNLIAAIDSEIVSLTLGCCGCAYRSPQMQVQHMEDLMSGVAKRVRDLTNQLRNEVEGEPQW